MAACCAPAWAQNQTASITLPAANSRLPYDLNLAVDDFGATAMPTLHSFASAQQNGDWIMIGGRTNGVHGFTSGLGSFPSASENQAIWMIDPVTRQSWSRSLVGSGLSAGVIDALSASSFESMQVGNQLYVIGGYGLDSGTGNDKTFDTLTAINLDSLMQWVRGDSSAPPATSIFRTIQDPLLQVTGGGLAQIDGRAMLVFGQNFDGNFDPSANGNYTSQVRSFTIVDSGTALSIKGFGASPSPGDDSQFRRTHDNLVGILHRDPVSGALSEGLVALGGVFTTTSGIWTVPVTIGADGVPHMADPAASSTLKQAVNVFSAANFGSFSVTTGANYISLFGGISYATYDSGTQTYSTDSELPFTNSLTTITIDRNGNMTQSLMAAEFPVIASTSVNPGNTLLFGTDAQFFSAKGIPLYDNGAVDLDAVMAAATSDNITLGYIFGGIASTLPNTNTSSDSMASNTVFAVTMALPPLLDLSASGTVTAGANDQYRRVVIENSSATYVIPAGSDVVAYGGTAVQNGMLDLNGTLDTHSLTITGSGVVRGTGTVNAPTVIAGTLRPGNSPGTMTFTQSVVQSAGGTLMLDIDGAGTGAGAGNYSRILVTGADSSFTAGGTIAPVLRAITGSANNNFSPALYQQFTVVSADGGIIGNFAGLTEPATGLAPGTRFDVLYGATTINLIVTPASYASLGALGGAGTINRMAAGSGIDGLRGAPGTSVTGDAGAVMNTVYGISPASLGPSLDQIAGAIEGDALAAASSLGRLVTGAVPRDEAANSAPFWIRATGQWTAIAGDGNAPGVLNRAGGVLAGHDLVSHDDVLFGIAGGYGVTDVATRNAATAHIETAQLVFYAGWRDGEWRFDDHVAGGYTYFRDRRLIQLGGLARTSSGNAGGWSASGDITVHYGDGPVVPFGEIHYDYVGRDAFVETGGDALSLRVRSGGLSTPRLVGGGDFDLDNLLGGLGWGLGGRLAWTHDFGPVAVRTNAALAGAPATIFSTYSSRTGQDALIAGLHAAKTIDDMVSIFAAYDLEARQRLTNHAITAGLRVQF